MFAFHNAGIASHQKPEEPSENIPLLLLLAFLITVTVGMTLTGLDAIDFVRQSECRTAVVAREMLASNDFLVPTINGRPRFEKPPLYYWAITAAASMTGEVSEAVARLPSVLSALTTVLVLGGFVWRRGLLLGQPAISAAGVVGLALICLPGFWQRATLADAESMLSLVCLGITICLYWNLRQPRVALLLGAYALSAVAFLVKGPIFLLFTWPAYLWIARRELKGQGRWHGLGLSLSVIGALSWYAAVLWHDAHALDVFRRELTMRFDSHEATHPQPIWFYFSQLFESTLPVGLLVPAALSLAWQQRHDKAEAFLLGNVAVAFVGLTLLKTKQAHYLMPILPWLAVWLGDLAWSMRKNAGWRWAVWAWLGLGGTLAVIAAVLALAYGVAWLTPVFMLLAVSAGLAAHRLGDYPLRIALIWTLAFTVGGYAANETIFKPLRGFKFEHSAYFNGLRELAASDGMVVAFDDACFYYYYGIPTPRLVNATSPVGVNYTLSTDGTPLGDLRNYHRGRMEWLWSQSKQKAVHQTLLSADGGDDFISSRTLEQQIARQSSCLTTEIWANANAAVLKIALNGECNVKKLLPDLLTANDLLQAQLVPWKLLWLENHGRTQNKLHNWLMQQILTRWVETSDASVVLDRTGMVGKIGKHAVPLLLTPQEFNNARLSVNNDSLMLTGVDGTHRWQRQSDGTHLRLLADKVEKLQ